MNDVRLGSERSVSSGAPLATGADRVTCASHAGVGAVARCLSCAQLICEECRESVRGSDYCRPHAAEAKAALAAVGEPMAWTAEDLADTWTRLLAYSIDGILLSLLSEIVALYFLWVIPLTANALLQFYLLAGLSLALIASLYCTLLVGAYGQTAGHWLLGLRVLRTDGTPPSYGRALLRWLGYVLCTGTAFLGFALVLFDRRKQGLHDKLADTIVVGPGLPLATKLRFSLAVIALVALGLVATDRLFGLFS